MSKASSEGVESRLFTPDFVFATLANFFYSFGSQTLVATLPVYVLYLGGSQADAGLVAGTLAFTALLFRPLVGWLTDIWSRRPLVLVGTVCYGLASVVYLVATSVPALLFGRVVHGVGLANYTTAANAYLADIAPPARRGQAIGLFSAAQGLGLITGPAIGFFIISALGFQQLFYLVAGLAVVATVVSLFARERRGAPAKRPRWTPRTGIVAVEALPITWIVLCLGLGFGPVMAFLAIFAQGRGIANPGFFFTVQAIALVLSRTFAGYLADRWGRIVVAVPGIIALSISLTLLPGANDLAQFLVSAAFFGLGFGMAQPATLALLVDRVRPGQRGLAMSTYFTGFDIGISVGSIGFGALLESIGFGDMWLLAAACVLLGLPGLLMARRKSADRPAVTVQPS